MSRLKAAVDERDNRIRDLLAVLPPRSRDGRLTEEQTVAFLAERGRLADGSPIVTMPTDPVQAMLADAERLLKERT
jgi:hypothetical protein